jgi:methylmalonyl-CoA mutase C-terminal domain/subunit
MDREIIRVLVAKMGLDGHDRGSLIVTQALKDAGMEVIYTGLKNTPEAVADIAIQEDVDVIGISILSGAHLVLVPLLFEALKRNSAEDIPVLVGGVIPPPDIPRLKGMGVKEVFPPGSSLDSITEYIRCLKSEKSERK